MNIHKIILPYTPEPIKEFFDVVTRIEEKIANGQDFSDEIKKITDTSAKIYPDLSQNGKTK